MNGRVHDAMREGTAAVKGTAGHERTISKLGNLVRIIWHEPVVVALFLIAAFTTISGRPVNGALIALIAAVLASDNVRHPDRGQLAGPARAQPPSQRRGPASRRRALLLTAGLAIAGVLYAAVVGSFTRYSWPATVAVVGLASVVVAAGWRGPRRPRPDRGQLPWPGAALWAVLLVAAGLWELAALFLQPSLTTTSYAHPTISGLTDPLLASHLGRSVALGIWVAVGWYLERR